MTIGWNVKMYADQLQWIVFAIAAYSYGRFSNRINKASMITFLIWTLFDFFVYIYNYKTLGYFVTYFWLPVVWFLAYFWNSKQADKLWHLLHNKK